MKKYIIIALLLLPLSASATDITYSTKEEGDYFTHADANEIKTVVNSKQNRVSGTCSEGVGYYITSINADGSVNCAADELGAGSDDQTASEVSVTDAGEYFSGSNVESILQEIGAASFLTLGAIEAAGLTFTDTADVDVSGANSFTMGPISFEGATADEYETTFSITDPTADRTIATIDADMRIPAASSVNSDGTIPIPTTGTSLALSGTLTAFTAVTEATSERALTTAELGGGVVLVSFAGEVRLPDVCDTASGAMVMIVQEDPSEVVEIAVTDTADHLWLDGVDLGANYEIDSPGAAIEDDYIVMFCKAANNWHSLGRSGTWVTGGAAD